MLRSNFHAASCRRARPTINEKIKGNAVASCVLVSQFDLCPRYIDGLCTVRPYLSSEVKESLICYYFHFREHVSMVIPSTGTIKEKMELVEESRTQQQKSFDKDCAAA